MSKRGAITISPVPDSHLEAISKQSRRAANLVSEYRRLCRDEATTALVLKRLISDDWLEKALAEIDKLPGGQEGPISAEAIAILRKYRDGCFT